MASYSTNSVDLPDLRTNESGYRLESSQNSRKSVSGSAISHFPNAPFTHDGSINTISTSSTHVRDTPDAYGGADSQERSGGSTVVRDDSTTNQDFQDAGKVNTGIHEVPIIGKKNSVKRPSAINLDQEFPPRYSDAIDGDATFYSPPSYKTGVNSRRSLNMTSNTSIFDDSTLPPMDDSMLTLPESLTTVVPIKGMEEQVEDLKARLHAWRSVLLVGMDVLLWEKKWYPVALLGVNTFVFLMACWMELSLLSSISILGVLVTAVDFLVPLLAPIGLVCSHWSETDEKRFESVLSSTLILKGKIVSYTVLAARFRREMPRTTSVSLALILLLNAWFFAKVDNTFLLYLLTTSLLLTPGMHKFGVLRAANDLTGRVKTYLITRKTSLAETPRQLKSMK